MKKYLLFVISFFLFSSFPLTAKAEGPSLTLSPSVIELTTNTPAEIYAPFTLTNNSDTSSELLINYRPFKPSDAENGQVTYLPEPFSEEFITLKKQWSIIDQEENELSTIQLGPKQQKKLRLKMILPKQKESKDVNFSLILLTKQENVSPLSEEKISFSNIRAGIAMHILLTLNPTQEKPSAALQEFSTPFYTEASPIPFTVRVYNKGIHRIKPKGIILIKNMFGQTVGRIDLTNETILGQSTRALADNKEHTTEIQRTKGLTVPVSLWEEKGLLGWYTASLSLAVSEQGPILTKDTPFVVFPLTGIIAILVGLLLLIGSIIRIRSKL